MRLATRADVAGLAGPGSGPPPGERIAALLLAGIVYGLAAAGLYTQGKTWADRSGGGQ